MERSARRGIKLDVACLIVLMLGILGLAHAASDAAAPTPPPPRNATAKPNATSAAAAARRAKAASASADASAAAASAAQTGVSPGQVKSAVRAAVRATANGTWWRPKASERLRFQYQLINKFEPDKHFVDGVQVYVIDGFDNDAETVAALKAKGTPARAVYPVCYISAGTREDWRPDADAFLDSDLGDALPNWPGERWLDVASDNVRSVVRKRLEMCRDKGFIAVDADNLNAYTNPTGLGLTAGEQADFNIWLAQAAHELGLGVGLKNDIEQVEELDPLYDFYVNEMCHMYNECDAYAPAKRSNKPVFGIEYDNASFKAACANATRSGITPLGKKIQLDSCLQECGDKAPRCPGGAAASNGGGGGGGRGAGAGAFGWWLTQALCLVAAAAAMVAA